LSTLGGLSNIRSRYINGGDLEKIIHNVPASERLPFEIAVSTGLRIGDVVAIRLDQIDDSGDNMLIRFVAQKTGKEGSATIPPPLAARIRRQMRSLRTSKFLFPPAKRYAKTPHLTRQTCWARMKRAARAAGVSLDGVSPHSLRKVYAVDLRHEKGLAAVRDALQHSNDAVTRVYAYADTVLNFESDEPIRWRDLELVVDYVLERLHEKNA